jgi:hypothetical protein
MQPVATSDFLCYLQSESCCLELQNLVERVFCLWSIAKDGPSTRCHLPDLQEKRKNEWADGVKMFICFLLKLWLNATEKKRMMFQEWCHNYREMLIWWRTYLRDGKRLTPPPLDTLLEKAPLTFFLPAGSLAILSCVSSVRWHFPNVRYLVHRC